jgi:hypothetical protein
MNTYATMLDGLVKDVEAALGVPATRDPSEVAGLVSSGKGCIFVGFPAHFQRLLDGPNLDVPVSLVAPAPSDMRAVDWLLDHIDALIEFCAVGTSLNRPLDIGDLTYPAVTVTARIAL